MTYKKRVVSLFSHFHVLAKSTACQVVNNSTQEEAAHHESSYADATIAARRRSCLRGSSGSHPRGRLEQDLGGCKDDNAEKDIEEGQRCCGDAAAACRCPLEQGLLERLSQWNSRGDNFIFPTGAATLAGVLGQCSALTHVNLKTNPTARLGAEGLASMLAQCTALTHRERHQCVPIYTKTCS